jgi:hypothetical protein
VQRRFDIPARIIQRAWRKYREVKKRWAICTIEDAILHYLYRPGGPMYNRILLFQHSIKLRCGIGKNYR